MPEAGLVGLSLPLLSCVILATSGKFSVPDSSLIKLGDMRLSRIKVPSSYKTLSSFFISWPNAHV